MQKMEVKCNNDHCVYWTDGKCAVDDWNCAIEEDLNREYDKFRDEAFTSSLKQSC